MDAGRRRPWTIIRGADLPADHGAEQAASSLVVNQTLFDTVGLPPGSRVRLRASCEAGRAAPTPRSFTIVGVAQFPFDDEGQNTAVISRAALRAICGDVNDVADMVLVASSDGASAAVSAIRSARPDLYAFTNEQIVARMQAQGFTYFRQISAVLSTITLLFGFLLITVLLTVSVNQRLAEIAALRALGFSRTRVVKDVLAESALIVGIGGLLSLPLGLLLASGLDRILKAMPGIPVALHFFVFERQALAVHVALLVATAIVAALYPMRIVSKLPIAATLRDEVIS
jgi:putative ABC transport system permease protein